MNVWETVILKIIQSIGGKASLRQIYGILEKGTFIRLSENDLRETQWQGRSSISTSSPKSYFQFGTGWRAIVDFKGWIRNRREGTATNRGFKSLNNNSQSMGTVLILWFLHKSTESVHKKLEVKMQDYLLETRVIRDNTQWGWGN